MRTVARSEGGFVGSLVALVFVLWIGVMFYDSLGPAIDQLLDQRLMEANRILK